jgi:hypothetical protein
VQAEIAAKAKEIAQLKEELMVYKVTENINDKNKNQARES